VSKCPPNPAAISDVTYRYLGEERENRHVHLEHCSQASLNQGVTLDYALLISTCRPHIKKLSFAYCSMEILWCPDSFKLFYPCKYTDHSLLATEFFCCISIIKNSAVTLCL